MRDPDSRDRDLQEYLDGKSALSEVYEKATGEEPGPVSDATILAAAREHASVEREVAHSPFSRSWLIPASLAAVLALSVSIVLLMTSPVEIYDADLGVVSPSDRKRETAGTTGAPDPSSASRATATAPALRSLPAELERRESSRLDQGKEQRRQLAPTSEAAPEALGRAAAVQEDRTRALGKAEETDQAESLPAEVWLARIRALYESGSYDRARQELDLFQRRYPGHPIEDLLSELEAAGTPGLGPSGR